MPEVRSNGMTITYETLGDPADPALLLIMGLGAQLVDWPDEFCELLAGRGYHVIRFDNRDIGLSTWLDDLPLPDLGAVFGGDFATVPYRLSDMAADTAGLLKELGVQQAHVVGASMGGMIAQQLAIDRPDLVASLCSIMSTTGDRTVGHPTAEAAAALMRPPATSREDAVAGAVAGSKAIGSWAFGVFDVPEDEIVRKAAAKYDRAYHPAGTSRQYGAIVASPDRTAALGAVTVPTLVVHGEADPLVDVSGGRATAAAVPGAKLLVIPGMGHDLPRAAWPQIVDAIVANAGGTAA
jgi:pimeloyl-ACP methyl ester carboxylesterase